MFRRRKAVESERSPNSAHSKQNNHHDEGMWFKKPSTNRVSSTATNAATASLVHMVASSSPTPDRRSTINSGMMSRDSYRNNNYSHQRGQDDDDESTQRPDETQKRAPEPVVSKRPYNNMDASSPRPPSSITAGQQSQRAAPAAASSTAKGSMLKGGDLIALIVCEEWEQASKALDDNPKVARMPQQMTLEGLDSQGLPLHLTACSRPPFKFVEKLLLAFPDATKTPDELTGRLPLHWACICKASTSILRLLLDHYPSALASLDSFDGRLPLHHACMYGTPDVVELLVSLEKRAVVYKDNSGLTPYDLIEQSRNNPHRAEILRILDDAKSELEIAKQKRHREREKAAAAAAAAATADHDHQSPPTPRKLPPMPIKDMPTPNTTNASKPNLKSDLSVYSDFDNAPSIDLQSASASLMTSPNSGNRKRTSLRTLLAGRKSAGANGAKLPPTPTLPIATAQAIVLGSPQDESYATAQAVAGSPWSTRPNGSGFSQYTRNANSSSLQRAATHSNVHFSQSSLPDNRYAAVDNSQPSLPEPPLTRGRSGYDKTQSESYIGVAKAPPPNNNHYSGSSGARSEVFSSYAQELSIHRQKLTEKDSELSSLDAQVRMLEVRRQVLEEECRNAQASVLEKQSLVDRKQNTIARLKAQLAQLQADLEAEEAALEVAESSLMVNRETLSEHEQKMRSTEEERNSLSAIRESVLDQKRELHRSVSSLEMELQTLESIQDHNM